MGTGGHWERVYERRGSADLSWFEPLPEISLELIDEAGLQPGAGILDVGGGTSGLAGELLARGHTDITVADISAEALDQARQALGTRAADVSWVQADVRGHDFGRVFDLWHDRALLHFMVERSDREGYVATLRRALVAGGTVIIATFGPQGPRECSGLPVCRYDADSLLELLGEEFELRSSRFVDHRTPVGEAQQFLYARLTRQG